MKILFGVRKGDEDWREVIITEREERFEDARKWAETQGYDRFRIASIDDAPPDFAATVRKL